MVFISDLTNLNQPLCQVWDERRCFILKAPDSDVTTTAEASTDIS